jgi:DNA polymerase-3 subunit delta
MSSPTAVTYLFHGQDEPKLREQLESFCNEILDPAMADLNMSRLSGKAIQLGDIRAAAGSLPFMADVRLVLVENFTEHSNAKDLVKELGALLEELPDSTRLVFVETNLLADRTGDTQSEQRRKSARRQMIKRLVNVVEKDTRGRVLSFDPPQKHEFSAWITERAQMHNAQIEQNAAQLLAERINEDLVLADTELEKLAVYVNGERPITRDDVDELTPYSPDASIFAMVDALGQRDGKKSLKLLHRLLDEGDEPLRIFAMIVRQYRLLILMREQMDLSRSPKAAAEAVGVRDWIGKKLAGQARNYRDIEQLEQVYRYLLDLDTKMKTGRIQPALALDELITRLARRD